MPSHAPDRSDVSLRLVAVVALAATLLAFVATWPLVRHADVAIPYGYGAPPEAGLVGLVPGDHLQFFTFLGLPGRAPLFRDPFQFRDPDPDPRATFFFVPFNALFVALGGGPLAYDILVWASFPATALAGLALARALGLGAAGAAFAGLALAVFPHRLGSLAGGHPSGLAFFLMPLVLAGVVRAWREGHVGAGVAAGLGAVVLAVNEPHYLYFTFLVIPLAVIAATPPAIPAREILRPRTLGALAFAALGPTLGYAAWASRWRGVEWGLLDGVVLFVFFGGLVGALAVFGAWLRVGAGEDAGGALRSEAVRTLPLAGLGAYAVQLGLDAPGLGRILVVLAALGWLAGSGPRLRALVGAPRRVLGVPGPGPAIALAGLALGAVLVFHYKATFVDASAAAGGREAREVELFSPRPADLLDREATVLSRHVHPGWVLPLLALAAIGAPRGRLLLAGAALTAVLSLGPHGPEAIPVEPLARGLVPFFSLIRQSAKFTVLVALALALAGGLGLGVLLGRLSPRWRGLGAAVAVIAVSLDSLVVLPFRLTVLPLENSAYAEVRRRAGDGNLLELPLWPGDSAYSSIYQYWTTRTHVGTVNGYSPTAPRDYVTKVVEPLSSMNLGELTEVQHERLAELRVGLVTVHRDTFPRQVSVLPYRFTLDAMRANPNLRFLADDEGVFLFERLEPYREWNADRPDALGIFWEGEGLLVGDGRVVEAPGASGGRVVVAAARAAGESARPVVYGPYRDFPRGRWVAWVALAGRGRLDVVVDRGRRTLAVRDVVTQGFEPVPIEFRLEAPATVEVRAFADAAEDLAVDWVLVEKLEAPVDRAAPGLVPRVGGRLEAERSIPLSGADRELADASGGAAALVVPTAAPLGSVVREGPYRFVERGSVELAVRARGEGLVVELRSADGVHRFGRLQLPADPEWREARTTFAVDRSGVVVARVVSQGVAAEVDWLEVRAVPVAAAVPVGLVALEPGDA